jgi:hypothetical protein
VKAILLAAVPGRKSRAREKTTIPNGLKEGIGKRQPGTHHGERHHQRRYEEHERHKDHGFVDVNLPGCGHPPENSAGPCQRDNDYSISESDRRLTMDQRYSQWHKRQRSDHLAGLPEILCQDRETDRIAEPGCLFWHAASPHPFCLRPSAVMSFP